MSYWVSFFVAINKIMVEVYEGKMSFTKKVHIRISIMLLVLYVFFYQVNVKDYKTPILLVTYLILSQLSSKNTPFHRNQSAIRSMKAKMPFELTIWGLKSDHNFATGFLQKILCRITWCITCLRIFFENRIAFCTEFSHFFYVLAITVIVLLISL